MKTFQRQCAVFTAIAALTIVGTGATVRAEILIPNIDRAIGSGANTILFAVDFNDGQIKEFVTWSLSYDDAPGEGRIHDALVSLASQDTALTYHFSDFSWGMFVDGFTVDDSPVFHHKNRLENTEDPWAETFAFWVAEPSDTEWTSSDFGISDTQMVDGNLYGFSWGAWPQPPPNAIPEPNMIALFLVGMGVFTWLRRRF